MSNTVRSSKNKAESRIKLSVMMPCYLEKENLEVIIPKINDVLCELGVSSEILVVDTMSPMDSTPDLCGKLFEQGMNSLRYTPRRGGNNYGDAIRTGIKEARGEYLVVMDADGSHEPKDIARLYHEMESAPNCTVVIGSRYMKGGDTDNGFILKLMSRTLNVFYRVLFRLKVKDVSDSYRIYRTRLLKKMEFECDNFDIVEEILIKLRDWYPRREIREIPVCFNKRVYGESKRDLWKFILSYLSTIRRLKAIQKGKN